MPEVEALRALAGDVIQALAGRTLAVAESLTGGLIGAALTEVPGASLVFRGAIVCYATDLKVSELDVDEELIASGGAVQAQVAFQMAAGVCRRLHSEFGLAVTGVAGPASQDGCPPGTVYVSVVVCAPSGEVTTAQTELLSIDVETVAREAQRAYIRSKTVEHGLLMLRAAVGQASE